MSFARRTELARSSSDTARARRHWPGSNGARSPLRAGGRTYEIAALDGLGGGPLERLPYSIRVLLENVLRAAVEGRGDFEDVEAVAGWSPAGGPRREVSFTPARVLLQDFTGVPALVDLAAMRDAIRSRGGDPGRVNPGLPVELVIDHSIQVDEFGTPRAFRRNAELELERNRERYAFLKWAQQAFEGLRIVPPASGIVHQVNLEYLARVVFVQQNGGRSLAYPDTVVGTDSHTTMVNGLGVLGWGVGGIEAEAVMLGQPLSLPLPEVVGVKMSGDLAAGVTTTDVALTVTELLRGVGVVGKFVEFFGAALSRLRVADRATLANMAPEYGATCGFFPIDEETLRYLELTGRPAETVALVEAYARTQRLFYSPAEPDPAYSQTVELDLARVEPSLAGPKRPQDRVPLQEAKRSFTRSLDAELAGGRPVAVPSPLYAYGEIGDGSVVIAAITSCTNTSNPSAMVAAGLLAKKAVERGLTTKPWVKTSLAPGSKVVTDYLGKAGLTPYLDRLGFSLVGYGCTTCIGNSGPLPAPISRTIRERDLAVCAVLSGNRNFEGRIHPEVRLSYLTSPPLVVAYALAGRMDIDLLAEPLGKGADGEPVYLRGLWPSEEEIEAAIAGSIEAEMFRRAYADVFHGDERWRDLEAPSGGLFAWAPSSTYVRQPPYFEGPMPDGIPGDAIAAARCLVLLGDSVTTDHISPAGAIPVSSPAGRCLIEQGVEPRSFNTYGSRRGNHEVMVRGTFANVRLRNLLAPGTEGGVTLHLPDGELMPVYEAARRYRADGVPLVVIAGREYGAGSSRDWAAKGTRLLGVRVVIAESYERIHRSNLIGMGVLPLEFSPGASSSSLGLTGHELLHFPAVGDGNVRALTVVAEPPKGRPLRFRAIVRVDTPRELEHYRSGGILPYALDELLD